MNKKFLLMVAAGGLAIALGNILYAAYTKSQTAAA